MNETLLFILLPIFSFGTAIISGVVGMAGGITLLSFMTFLLPLNTIIPLHGIVQLFSNGSRCFFLRRNIDKTITLFFFLGAPLGTYLAYSLIKEVSNKNIFFLLVIALILYTLFKPKKLPPLIIPKKSFFFLGLLTGFIAPLMGATGPLLAPFFLREDLSKEAIVATKASVQMFTHLLKIPLFLAIAFPYQEYFPVLVLMVLGAILGTKVGVVLLGRVSKELFTKIYKIALLFAVCRLIYKIFLVSP